VELATARTMAWWLGALRWIWEFMSDMPWMLA